MSPVASSRPEPFLRTLVTTLVVALGLVGLTPVATGDPGDSTESPRPIPPVIAPPPIHKARVATAPVSVLHPGAPIMVGVDTPDDDPHYVEPCQLGFYVDYPGSDGRRRPGFVTAGPCAQQGLHTRVFVTKTFVYRQVFEQTEIGEIAVLGAGDAQPTTPDQPWTIPTPQLAVLSPGPADWPLPVDTTTNDQPATDQIIGAARSVWGAAVTWTDEAGRLVTGRVLDPAGTPELASIPAGIERVVIAADDAAAPIYSATRGSPVTAQIDGGVGNLGIVVAVDPDRHWVVADLISPFLAAHQAQLRTSA